MIPPNTQSQIDEYVKQKCPPGSFVYAVLTNNLVNAVAKADDVNILYLRDIILYVYNDIPSACWGSREAVEEWLNPKVNPDSKKIT